MVIDHAILVLEPPNICTNFNRPVSGRIALEKRSQNWPSDQAMNRPPYEVYLSLGVGQICFFAFDVCCFIRSYLGAVGTDLVM